VCGDSPPSLASVPPASDLLYSTFLSPCWPCCRCRGWCPRAGWSVSPTGSTSPAPLRPLAGWWRSFTGCSRPRAMRGGGTTSWTITLRRPWNVEPLKLRASLLPSGRRSSACGRAH